MNGVNFVVGLEPVNLLRTEVRPEEEVISRILTILVLVVLKITKNGSRKEEMKIIKKGNPEKIKKSMTGKCLLCGCIVECEEAETQSQFDMNETLYWVNCPMEGCSERIWLERL